MNTAFFLRDTRRLYSGNFRLDSRRWEYIVIGHVSLMRCFNICEVLVWIHESRLSSLTSISSSLYWPARDQNYVCAIFQRKL